MSNKLKSLWNSLLVKNTLNILVYSDTARSINNRVHISLEASDCQTRISINGTLVSTLSELVIYLSSLLSGVTDGHFHVVWVNGFTSHSWLRTLSIVGVIDYITGDSSWFHQCSLASAVAICWCRTPADIWVRMRGRLRGGGHAVSTAC